ncbi:MAG: PAS domain S-box protein [Candidatus Omnitrophica bacterium]|nr:PAS domain S-box protein [Candidatus Omnitrophota bacterium]MCF7895044.1 PAS domain S-box protein [Candidatus Omnitrophota bacterium]
MENDKHLNDRLKSLKIYKRIINFTKDGVFSYNFNQGKILFANQALVDILGLEVDPKKLIGKKVDEIIEYIQDPGTVREKLKKEGQIHNFEYNFKTLAGQDKWVMHNAFLREADGEKIVESVIRDITYQKKIEKEILFNQFVLDHMSNPVLWITSEGGIDYVNQAAIDILDYSKEELLGSKIFDIDDNFFQADWPEFWEKIKKQKTLTVETTYKTKTGKTFPVEIIINYMRYNHSQHLCAVVRNLTERHRVESALRRSEEEKSLILDSLSEFVAYYDNKLNLLWVNKAVSEVVGESSSRLIGLNWNQVWEKVNVEVGVHPVKSVIQTGKFHKKEVTSRDGKSWLIRAYPVKNIEDKIVGIVEVALDISQRKSAEYQRQLNLNRTRRILEETVGALAATSERRDPYTAGHQRRVSQLACAIAKELGFSPNRLEGIRMAANIHDVGKVYVPAEILSKPTTLTQLEFNIIQTHPQIGYDILKEIEFPWPIAKIVLQHHEKLNGVGYPNGIRSKEILVGAKILIVADVVEAMASHRPYRAALGINAALSEIEKGKGELYDPEIVEICLKLFNRKKFKFK